MKYVDYAESWYKIWCPYCNVVNWVCNGNEQDITGMDIEGTCCHSCGKVFMSGPRDEITIELNGGEYPLGNWNIEDGKERPI